MVIIKDNECKRNCATYWSIFTSSWRRRLSHIQRIATLLWSQFSHEGCGTWFLFTDAAWRHNPGRWLSMLILWNTHTCKNMCILFWPPASKIGWIGMKCYTFSNLITMVHAALRTDCHDLQWHCPYKVKLSISVFWHQIMMDLFSVR
jgi:hypothetical protein